MKNIIAFLVALGFIIYFKDRYKETIAKKPKVKAHGT